MINPLETGAYQLSWHRFLFLSGELRFLLLKRPIETHQDIKTTDPFVNCHDKAPLTRKNQNHANQF